MMGCSNTLWQYHYLQRDHGHTEWIPQERLCRLQKVLQRYLPSRLQSLPSSADHFPPDSRHSDPTCRPWLYLSSRENYLLCRILIPRGGRRSHRQRATLSFQPFQILCLLSSAHQFQTAATHQKSRSTYKTCLTPVLQTPRHASQLPPRRLCHLQRWIQSCQLSHPA